MTIGSRVAVAARSTESYTCTGRPLVAGLRWLPGVQRLIAALGDHWLQGCDGCKEYRDFYVHWETIGCRVAMVARSTVTYTCTGRPLVAGLRCLRRVQRLIPALGDHWLQVCDDCEEYRDLYLHWKTIGCWVAMVARSTETYTCTGRPLVAGLRWLCGVQRLLPAVGDHCWRVAAVARSTVIYTCTGIPLVAGLRVFARSTKTYTCSGRPLVAMFARSTETYTCTGRSLVAGLRFLRGVQIVIPALGDHKLHGCDGCEEYRDL